jgi:trigger factor
VKLSVERQAGSIVVLDIAADDEEFAQSMDRAFRKVSKDIQIPGFRKGKAPRGIIERFYGREIFLQDAADDVMDKLYRQALQQEELTPVGEPDVEIVELEPVNFKVTVPVYPAIDPGDYAAVRVEPQDAAVTDADVEEVLERLRKSQATWVDPSEARAPREGDQVTVDYEVKEGDEDFQEPVEDAQFILGETNLLQQLREKIEEMQVGDTETFELAFDENDETADPSIRGKALSYTVTLKSIKERELAELDDEFAKSVADADSLVDLRDQIREDVHQGKTSDARTSVVNEIIAKIAEGAEIDPPAVMVDEEVEHQLGHLKQNLAQSGTPFAAYLRAQGKTEDDLKVELRPEAERRLRNSLILQEIAKREQVEVTDDEIDEQLDSMFGGAADGEDDEARARRERVREMYRGDYFRNMLRSDLFDRKLTDRLIERATEGKGAVLNAWEPKELDTTAEELAGADETAGAVAAAEAAEAAEADQAELETAGGETVAAAEAAEAAGGETAANGAEALVGESGDGWVKGDGENNVPEGYPIKGNASSMIYHPQESRFYDNTVAEYYFASPEVAESFGFRAPKGIKAAGASAGGALADLAGDDEA